MGKSVRTGRRVALVSLVATAVALTAFAAPAGADGTEQLGVPSIPISAGSGVITAGTGTAVQPASIGLEVPGGATVEQVLLYWEGQAWGNNGDATIDINGVPVTGTMIGGPTGIGFRNQSISYRADITARGVIAPGPNSVTVSGMSFNKANGGAGIMVIYSDGTTSEIVLFDGNDVAFGNWQKIFCGESLCPASIGTTEAKTYAFAPASVDRSADLDMFFSSVQGPDLAGQRPSVIKVTVGGVVTEYVDVLASNDGDEWDTFQTQVNIPAGVTSVTVQALSEDRNGTGLLPASLIWNAGSLSITVPRAVGGEGCTPGYWRQEHHFGSWTGYAPSDLFESVFGVDASNNPTLLQAVKANGGGEFALQRHAVAALLNSTSAGVDYKWTAAQVISMVQSAYANGTFESVKNALEEQNESGCRLGRADLPGTTKVKKR